jgi:hypothetical protein
LDATDDVGLRLWRVATREVVRVFGAPESHSSGAAFSPDGELVASAGEDGTLRVWNAKSGAALHVIKDLMVHPSCLAFYPDAHGSRLAVGFYDGTIKIWDTRKWQVVATLQCDNEWLDSIAFDAEGRRLASGSSTGRIWLFDSDPVSTRTAATRTARAHRDEAEKILTGLVVENKTGDELVADLVAAKNIGDDVRGAAIRLIRTRTGRPEDLFQAAWDIVGDCHATPAQYRRARDIAASLMNLKISEGRHHTLLGMAEFRIGNYPAALAALTRARVFDTSGDQRIHGAICAFLSMVQFQLGDRLQAVATLGELRESGDHPTEADEQIAGFVQEAEALIRSTQ